MRRASYRLIVERDESGAWIARVPGVRGCHTHGRTLEQARKRIREALGLWVNDADTAAFAEELRLPTKAQVAIDRSRRVRREAEHLGSVAQAVTREAARTLVEEAHLGLRDAAELLGLPYQRVRQLVRR
jgi:predicted RNase H-like HicB family nuclease